MKSELKDIKKIIVSRTDSLGDVILTLPVITELIRLIPDSEIYFLVRKSNLEILSGYPGIHRILIYDESEKFSEKLKYFQDNKFDAAISVYPRFEIALLFFLSRIKIRIGTAFRWYSFLFNKKVFEHRKYAEKHESDYNLNLLKSLSQNINFEKKFYFNYTNKELESFEIKAKSLNFSLFERYLIMHPGSKKSARDWSINKFCELTKLILKEYPDFKIVLTGISDEAELTNEIKESINENDKKRVIDLAGKINLRELLILIEKSLLFISNSTGPIHIAGALNKKIIGFYPDELPMSATRWKPLSENAVILSPGKSREDINAIPVEEAFLSVKNLLS